MILIFGGTTEGRVAVRVCERADKPLYYSTKGGDQVVESKNMVHLSGAMCSEDIKQLCQSNDIELIVDAAHPYAAQLHRNIVESGVTAIRFDRLPIKCDCLEFDSMAEVVEYLKEGSIDNILALTGVNSAPMLAEYARTHRVTLRIMDREESRAKVEKCDFPRASVIYYDEMQDDELLLERLRPDVIITKESGESGGFGRKLELSKRYNIPLLVIRRPRIDGYNMVVYGEHGLRRAIENILPDYFDLRSGFTTGSAATAASVAALSTLLNAERCESVVIELPNGEPYIVDIEECEIFDGSVQCSVIKDGGDDPDATDGVRIRARVELVDSNESSVEIRGASGVGVVTLPGLGIDVGEAAINSVPRQMITSNLLNMLSSSGVKAAVKVVISVDNGEQIGLKTFNPRLGVVGGISILGTSGIVTPFSAEAFLESIDRQIDIVRALGESVIVINSGAKSERLIKARYGEYPPHSYIHYGNLIGATIELAARAGISKVVLGVMIGKCVKLAEGALDTHSRSGLMNREFITSLARQAGCSDSTVEKIKSITTARQLWDVVPEDEKKIFELITQRSYEVCKPLLPNGELEVILLAED